MERTVREAQRRSKYDHESTPPSASQEDVKTERDKKETEEDDDDRLVFRTPLIVVFVIFLLFSLALYLDCWPCAVTTGMAFLSSIASACL
mmetsp:Transcript_9539/g.13193  ORF Transcript_9539/g.13193 Transcript_9539/m.13193 type:complete len:90 (+) Transcript_9539:121-390(+)